MFNLKDPGMTMEEYEIVKKMEDELNKCDSSTQFAVIIRTLIDNQKILDRRTEELKEYHNKLVKDYEDKMQEIYTSFQEVIKLIEVVYEAIKEVDNE